MTSLSTNSPRSPFDWKHPLSVTPSVPSHPRDGENLTECFRDRMISDPDSEYNKTLSHYALSPILPGDTGNLAPIQTAVRSATNNSSFVTRSKPSDFPWLDTPLLRVGLFVPHGTPEVRDYAVKFFKEKLPESEQQSGSINRAVLQATLAITETSFSKESMEKSGTEGVYAVFDEKHQKAVFYSWGNTTNVVLYRAIESEIQAMPVTRMIGWNHPESRRFYQNTTNENPPLVIAKTPETEAWQRGEKTGIRAKEIYLKSPEGEVTSCASGLGFYPFSRKVGEKGENDLRRHLINMFPKATRVDLRPGDTFIFQNNGSPGDRATQYYLATKKHINPEKVASIRFGEGEKYVIVVHIPNKLRTK